jgi:transposase
MVNHKISVDRKECSLWLWELGWDTDSIAETLCISTTSMYRWRKIFEDYDSVKRPLSPLIGRPRIIVRAILTAIQEVYKNEADAYLDELMWWLNIAISHSTLQRNLEEAGLTQKLLHKIARERDAEIWDEYLAVIQDHIAGDGKEFVFVDEMSKNDHDTARRYGRSLSGERADFIDNFVRGDRYSMVAAITIDGYIATRIVPGSFNAEELRDYITEQVVSIPSHIKGLLFIIQARSFR